MADDTVTVTTTATTVAKPGWKTTEFWLKLAAIALTAVYASGALTNNTALAIAGIAATILGALGYTVSRTIAKAALVLLVLGLAGSTQLSCAEVRPRAANGAVAGLQCEAPDVLAAMPDVVRFAIEAIRVWISGDGHIDPSGLAAAAKPIVTDLGKCAFDAAVAVLASPAPGAKAGAPAAAATTIAGSELEATWRNIRGELGWAARAAP